MTSTQEEWQGGGQEGGQEGGQGLQQPFRPSIIKSPKNMSDGPENGVKCPKTDTVHHKISHFPAGRFTPLHPMCHLFPTSHTIRRSLLHIVVYSLTVYNYCLFVQILKSLPSRRSLTYVSYR